MSANSRLTISVHALTWLALAHSQGHRTLTSERIAASIATNPVVVRRHLALLESAGLVAVEHGRTGGWSLSRPPRQITLLDVHNAINESGAFALHTSPPNQQCPVGRGIGGTLSRVYAAVDDAIADVLGSRTVADVLSATVPGA
ncbi:MAG: Rrf2 family transcriptional regulator [Actinomycetota bacterium]